MSELPSPVTRKCEMCGGPIRLNNAFGVCSKGPCATEQQRRERAERAALNGTLKELFEFRDRRARELQESWSERLADEFNSRSAIVRREHNRKRRERLNSAEGRYLDLTYLNTACCWCGNDLGDSPHADHVWPVARFDEFDAEHGPESDSALRMSCAPCNLSKGDTPPAVWLIRRFKAGQPVRQSVATRQGCPVLGLAPVGSSTPSRRIPSPGTRTMAALVAACP